MAAATRASKSSSVRFVASPATAVSDGGVTNDSTGSGARGAASASMAASAVHDASGSAVDSTGIVASGSVHTPTGISSGCSTPNLVAKSLAMSLRLVASAGSISGTPYAAEAAAVSEELAGAALLKTSRLPADGSEKAVSSGAAGAISISVTACTGISDGS